MYNNISKKDVLRIHKYVMEKRKGGFGQRNLARMVKEKFKENINEGTIANWIFYNKIPFRSEKTQFKSLPIPKKEKLLKLYLEDKQSAQKIAKKYKVSTIIVINWLNKHRIKVRTHKEAMNTQNIKQELREKRLRKPIKNFTKISPEKAYILGVLCGDGHIRKRMIRMEIRNDKEFIEEFARCIKAVYGLNYYPYYYLKRNSYIIYVSSDIISKDLMNYGTFRTFSWEVPKEILYSKNKMIISSFLRGVYDSDGSSSKYCINIVSASKKGIEKISYLLNIMKIKHKKGMIKNKYYSINITKIENLKKFVNKIGFTIKRKMEGINLEDGRTKDNKNRKSK